MSKENLPAGWNEEKVRRVLGYYEQQTEEDALIDVTSVDINAVLRFMSDLSESPFFGSVVLDQSQPSVASGKEVTAFTVTATYSRPDPKLLTRVPVALQVGGR